MARIFLPDRLRALALLGPFEVNGATTVCAALAGLFAEHPRLRGYLLDDQGTLRERVAVYVDGKAIQDPHQLSDAVGRASEIRVMGRLSPRRAHGVAVTQEMVAIPAAVAR